MSDEALSPIARQAGLHQVAYHEAGHLVLACITGVYLPDKAGLSIAGDHKAFAAFKPDMTLLSARSAGLSAEACSNALAVELGIIYAAGYAAEHRFLITQGFDPNTDALIDSALDDRKAIRAYNERLSDPFEVAGLFARFVAAADIYFDEDAVWSATSAIAEKLHAAPSLTLGGFTAYDLLQKHCPTDLVRLLSLP